MTPVLATALLSLLQGPYLPAPDSEPPANAPLWVSGETAEEHSFSVTASFDCPADTVGGHLQVSISDTTVRTTFSADENTWRKVLSLRVPSRQLRGLRPELFCPEPGGVPGPVLRLKSKFTAQGALVCRSADGRQTTAQSSAALDAWVRCPPLPEKPPATNAGASISPYITPSFRETHESIHGAWFRHPWLQHSRKEGVMYGYGSVAREGGRPALTKD